MEPDFWYSINIPISKLDKDNRNLKPKSLLLPGHTQKNVSKVLQHFKGLH